MEPPMRPVAVLAALAAACGGGEAGPVDAAPELPPPVVTGMEPTSGPYGTEIVIEGRDLGERERLLRFTGEDGSETEFGASEWIPTRIRAKVPFPVLGRGEISFCGDTSATGVPCHRDEGRVVAGSFTVDSAWEPGPGVDIPGEVLTAEVLPSGEVAAVFALASGFQGPPRLAVFRGDGAITVPIRGLPAQPHRLVLLESADGRAEIVAHSGEEDILHHQWSGDAFEAVDSGIDGRVLAGGTDADGRFVWVERDFVVSRLRIDDGWSVDREVEGGGFRTGALADDGTLVLARVERTGNALDYDYRLLVGMLPPGAGDILPLEQASPRSYEDKIPRVSVEAGARGDVVLARYCVGEAGSVNCLHRRVRDAAGQWTSLDQGTETLAVGDGALAEARTDERGIVILGDRTRPGDEAAVIPVYPALPEALIHGPDGFRVLVDAFLHVYAPRRRASE